MGSTFDGTHRSDYHFARSNSNNGRNRNRRLATNYNLVEQHEGANLMKITREGRREENVIEFADMVKARAQKDQFEIVPITDKLYMGKNGQRALSDQSEDSSVQPLNNNDREFVY